MSKLKLLNSDYDTSPFSAADRAMVQRLRRGERTEWDIRYYIHELKEYGKMKNGTYSKEEWEIAHTAVLVEQGIDGKDPGYTWHLYHPDVIRENRPYFPRAAWPPDD